MPRLPVVDIGRRNLRALNQPEASARDFGAGIGSALTGLGEVLEEIDDKQKPIELEKLSSEYELEADQLKRDSMNADDPDLSEAQYIKAEGDLRKRKLEGTKYGEVKAALESRIVKRSARDIIDVRTKAGELKSAQQLGFLERAEKEYAERAAASNDPREREELTGRFHGLVASATSGAFPAMHPVIGQRKIEAFDKNVKDLRKENFTTTVPQELDDLVNQARRIPGSAEQSEAIGLKRIDQTGGDLLKPQEVIDAKAKFTDALWHSAISGMIEKDAKGTKRALNAGTWDKKITQQSLKHLHGEADTEIAAIERKEKSLRTEYEREVGEQVKDYKQATMAGAQWSGNRHRLAEQVRGTKHEEEFRFLVGAESTLKMFGQAPPMAGEQLLRERESRPQSGDEAALTKHLRGALESNKAELAKDGLTFAIRQRVIPNLQPFDLNNPDSLKERSIAANLVETHYGVPTSPLSDDEATMLSNALTKAPAKDQAEILRRLTRGFEDHQVKGVAAQLARKKDDPVMVQAMGLAVDSPEAASHVLRGREILRENPEVGLKETEKKAAQDRIAKTLSEAYKHSPAHYSAVSDTAMSIYAYKAWQDRDLSGTLNTTRLDEAIKEAGGQILTLGSFGGRYTIQAPRYGTNENDFFELVKRADYSDVTGVTVETIQKHGIYESIGEGRYHVRVGPGYVLSKKGTANEKFVLDLNLPARGMPGAAIGAAVVPPSAPPPLAPGVRPDARLEFRGRPAPTGTEGLPPPRKPHY